MDDVYDFPSRPVPSGWQNWRRREKGGRAKGVRRGGHGARFGWQARNEQVTRSMRSSLTGIRTVDWLRIAYPRGGRERERERWRESAAEGATPVVSMDAEKSARAREERVVFFQSSNLLNLFFPRNVAAVSKLLIAIGKVEPMGWEGSRIERGRKGRAGGWLERGQAGVRSTVVWGGRTFRYIEKIGTSSTVARFVPFRFVSPRPRFGTLRYVCSAVHLLAQYRGGIIITRGKERERGAESGREREMVAGQCQWLPMVSTGERIKRRQYRWKSGPELQRQIKRDDQKLMMSAELGIIIPSIILAKIIPVNKHKRLTF